MARANRKPRKRHGSASRIQLYIPKDGLTLNVTTWPWQKLPKGHGKEQQAVPGIMIDGVKI